MARRKKRSRSFGERAHKGRNVLRAMQRAEAAGKSTTGSRRFKLTVFVGRYTEFVGPNADRRGRFYATVCPASHPSKWRKSEKVRESRCGPDGYGNTPTRAVEAALVALARSHNLRK